MGIRKGVVSTENRKSALFEFEFEFESFSVDLHLLSSLPISATQTNCNKKIISSVIYLQDSC